MTREEMIQLALQELGNLSPSEREIIYEHFGARAHDELAARIVEEATELWSPADESGVPTEDWVREYLHVTIDLFHDQRRAFEMNQLRAEAGTFVDDLGSELRALLCCMLGTKQRTRLTFIVAKLVHDAVEAGLVEGTDRRGAIKKTLEVHVAAYIDDVESSFFADQRRAGSN